MNTLKNYITGAALMVSAWGMAQLHTIAEKQYPAMYENQTRQLPSPSATPEKITLSAKELVDININTMMSDPVLRNADWGFVVYDPKTKKIVSSYNENSAFIPASTTKLLTTETALSMLGEKFRWTTQLEFSGEVDDAGNLNGNLYVIGSGDPFIGTGKAGSSTYSTISKDFMYALQERGIKKINGNIIVQTAIFKENKLAALPANVVWMEHHNYYLPVGTTLSINPANERVIAKKFNPFEEKTKRYFYISPYINKMVYAEQFDGGSLTTKIADAPYSLANNLRTTLVKNGIPVSGKVESRISDKEPELRHYITAYKSPALADLVYDINHRSDNALSEALLRTSGFYKNGDQTLESGKNTVTSHLAEVGFDMNGLSYSDGSGLSRNNMVTPISQVKYLTSIMDQKYYQTYFDSLPIAGQTGTLKRSFLTIGNGQVFAKTGTLNKVKTLAGYIKTNTGRTLAFSLLINNYAGSVDQVKNRMERILEPALEL